MIQKTIISIWLMLYCSLLTALGESTVLENDNVIYLPPGYRGDLKEAKKEVNYLYNRLRISKDTSNLVTTVPEVVSAEKDSSGNWGAIVDGLQLSLRFRGSEYQPGEPIVAVILFRNLESSEHPERWADEDLDNLFSFIIRHGTNMFSIPTTRTNPLPPHATSIRGTRLPPHGQELAAVRIDRQFNFNAPGEYSIQANRKIQCRKSNSLIDTNILSATATFRIVEKLSPSEVASREAFRLHQREVAERARMVHKSSNKSAPESK
jgi:hypothetical protein